MPLSLQCENFPLTDTEVNNLWQSVRTHTTFPDEHVALECVSKEEITRLNHQYRNKEAPTNVLTFSYGSDAEHDVALCMEVATEEASERDIAIRDYVALLVVHALLHVCGVDHEQSETESIRMKTLEQEILLSCGFVSQALSDVY
jgi:probable rRNA maturation factor